MKLIFLLKSILRNFLNKIGVEVKIIKGDYQYRKYLCQLQSIQERQIVNLAIKKPGSGVVVIIGAHDLVSYDYIAESIAVTDKRIFLFEPRPDSFKKLLENIQKLNLGSCQCFNLAVHPSLERINIYSVKPEKVDNYQTWIEGIASIFKDHLLKYVLEEDIESMEVNCSNPDNWYSDFDISQIDYLQIDTEGFDYEILKSINLIFYSPIVIRIELVNLKDKDKINLVRYLYDFGYDIIFNGEDIIAFDLSRLI